MQATMSVMKMDMKAGVLKMPLRREYACRAMQGILRVYCTVNDPERYALVAKDAVKYADALIDELRK